MFEPIVLLKQNKTKQKQTQKQKIKTKQKTKKDKTKQKNKTKQNINMNKNINKPNNQIKNTGCCFFKHISSRNRSLNIAGGIYCKKNKKGKLYLTENRISRNRMWCP